MHDQPLTPGVTRWELPDPEPSPSKDLPWMRQEAFPIGASPDSYGFRRWGRRVPCSDDKLRTLVARRASMGDRLVWTPESRYFKSVFEIPWLSSAAILRSRKFLLRWLVANSGLVAVQLFILARDVSIGASQPVIVSDLVALVGLLAVAFTCGVEYAETFAPPEHFTRIRSARARFLAWLMGQPAPWVWSICSVLVFITSLQHLSDLHSTDLFPPSARELGFSRIFTLQGEWWRMVTGPLLHSGPLHLFANLVGWLLLGKLMEPLLPRWTLPFVAVISAFASSAFSLFILPRAVSVGFSGAVSGMTALALILWMRRREELPLRFMGALLICILSGVVSDWNNSTKIDYPGHAAGFAAGLAIGFAIIDSRSRGLPLQAKSWLTRAGQICAGLLIADAIFVVGTLLSIIRWRELLML
jgi:membrane associated rhomboid family serine protease